MAQEGVFWRALWCEEGMKSVDFYEFCVNDWGIPSILMNIGEICWSMERRWSTGNWIGSGIARNVRKCLRKLHFGNFAAFVGIHEEFGYGYGHGFGFVTGVVISWIEANANFACVGGVGRVAQRGGVLEGSMVWRRYEVCGFLWILWILWW